MYICVAMNTVNCYNVNVSKAAFSREGSFATVVRFFNMIYTFRSSEEQEQELIILKNLTIAKLQTFSAKCN